MMKKEDVVKTFNEILSKGHLSPGIDKVGSKSIKKDKTNKLFDSYVDRVFNALHGEKYHFTKYKQLLKIKRADKYPRIISIPCLRDRLLFKCLYEFYLKAHVKRDKFEDVIRHISRDASSGHFDMALKLDICSFFDTINHDILKQSLGRAIGEKSVVDLIMKSLIIRTVDEKNNSRSSSVSYGTDEQKSKIGVPQGIIIGNAVAEIFAQDMDKDFNDLANTYDIRYHRFVDDILIYYNSSSVDEKTLLRQAQRIFDNYKLAVQDEKVKTYEDINKGVDFLGFVFRGKTISLTNDVIRKKERKIERVIFDFKNSIHKKVKNNYPFLIWKLNLEITGFVSKKVYYGWTSSYRFVDDYTIFYRLDSVVKKIYERAGLEKEEFTSIKSFVVAHKKICKLRDGASKYIPNFDFDYDTTEKKKDFLIKMYGINRDSSNDYIDELFDEVIRREIFEVDRDLDLKYGI